jgi:hypothetical protein
MLDDRRLRHNPNPTPHCHRPGRPLAKVVWIRHRTGGSLAGVAGGIHTGGRKAVVGAAAGMDHHKICCQSVMNDAELASLDAGEREAIQLAIELRPDLLLMDDRDGRTLALNLGLPVSGTLGILERAEVVGLLGDLPLALEQLEGSGFYLSERLRAAMLERHRLRHK